MTREGLIERMARAMAPAGCDCRGFGGTERNTCGCWVSHMPEARAALAALEAHAAVVPREPTREMQQAGKERADICLVAAGPDPDDGMELRPGGAASIWRAMLAASPFAREARDG